MPHYPSCINVVLGVDFEIVVFPRRFASCHGVFTCLTRNALPSPQRIPMGTRRRLAALQGVARASYRVDAKHRTRRVGSRALSLDLPTQYCLARRCRNLIMAVNGSYNCRHLDKNANSSHSQSTQGGIPPPLAHVTSPPPYPHLGMYPTTTPSHIQPQLQGTLTMQRNSPYYRPNPKQRAMGLVMARRMYGQSGRPTGKNADGSTATTYITAPHAKGKRPRASSQPPPASRCHGHVKKTHAPSVGACKYIYPHVCIWPHSNPNPNPNANPNPNPNPNPNILVVPLLHPPP